MRVIVVSAAVGLVLFALESFAGNLITNFLTYLGRRIPEAARAPIGYSLLSLLIWTGGCILLVAAWAYFDTRPQRRWREAERAKADLESQVKELENDRGKWRAAADEWHQQYTYGTTLKELPRLNEVDHQLMVNRLHELRPKFDESVKTAQAVWSAIESAAQTKGEGSALYWLRDRVDKTEAERAVTAVKGLWSDLSYGKDPRPMLACAYTRYALWREWILRFAVLSNLRLERLVAYPKWFAAEEEFFREFRSCLQIPQLKPVQNEVATADRLTVLKALSAPEPG